jgi:hypothetical protein
VISPAGVAFLFRAALIREHRRGDRRLARLIFHLHRAREEHVVLDVDVAVKILLQLFEFREESPVLRAGFLR